MGGRYSRPYVIIECHLPWQPGAFVQNEQRTMGHSGRYDPKHWDKMCLVA